MPVKFHQNEQLLAEALTNGIVALDAKGYLLWWNQKAAPLLGLSQNQREIIRIQELFPNKVFVTAIESNQPYTFENVAPHNEEIYLSLDLSPYHDEQFLLIVEDITHTHRLEMMRRDFIANVSHELRTPLTVLHGFLELLLENGKIDYNKRFEMLSQMNLQCLRMETLVHDLLWLARLESDQPDIEQHTTVSVAPLLRQICNDAETLSGDRQHQFILRLDEDLTIDGHPEELRSAFSNLIYNAVHYTPAKGTIEISWYLDASGKHMQVKDNGVGIPKKYIPRITQRFFRVDKARASRGKAGTGLGLAIVKHVLLRHGGELSIESEVNVGSTFICTFST